MGLCRWHPAIKFFYASGQIENMGLNKILLRIDKLFTWLTAVVLIVCGILFVYYAFCIIDELLVRFLVSTFGVFFLGGGIYYFIKSKQNIK